MRRLIYLYSGISVWVFLATSLTIAAVSTCWPLELYSCTPLTGSLQVYIDQSGWCLWYTPEEIFERYLQTGIGSYEDVYTDALLDAKMTESETHWQLAPGIYRDWLPSLNAKWLGLRHPWIIGATAALVALFHFGAGPWLLRGSKSLARAEPTDDSAEPKSRSQRTT